MSLDLTPITELEAINAILRMCGLQGVSSLEDTGLVEVSTAREILHDVSREVQTLGLRCNSEENYRLAPDVTGNILLPPVTLKADASDRTIDVAQRGGQLYDRNNHTFIFTRPVEVDIVFFLAFEDLPQVVRKYITVRAARQFQTQSLTSSELFQLTDQDERQAWLNLQAEEVDTEDFSIFDSYDTYRIINRH